MTSLIVFYIDLQKIWLDQAQEARLVENVGDQHCFRSITRNNIPPNDTVSKNMCFSNI